MLAGEYRERAHAKVNLGLAVLTRRGDGFHEIETLFARLALHDDVSVRVLEQGGATELVVEVEDKAGTLPGAELVSGGADNLMLRAAELYLQAYKGALEGTPHPGERRVLAGLRLRLVKRIPVAAGLGGGSADAAAVLRALHRADAAAGVGGEPAVSAADLAGIALELGSDVPFFLSGWQAAKARGRGERLEQVIVPPLNLVLINPRLVISAGQAYADLVGYTPRLRTDRALARLAEGLEPGWSNGLQPGVLRAHPGLREVLTALREAGLKGVLMSGSGSTCFGLAPSVEAAEQAARQLAEQHPAWWVTPTCTAAA